MTTLLVLSAVIAFVPVAPGGAAVQATQLEGLATSGPRVTMALPPGLEPAEHDALLRSGAYGAKPVHLLIVGDSIALTLGMGLSVGAEAGYGVAINNNATLGCDLDPQLEIREEGVATGNVHGCDEWQGLWPFLIARLRPQVVALGLGRWEVTDHFYNGRWVHIGEPVWDAHLTSQIKQAIAILHSFGAKVVLFTMPYIDPSQRQPNGMPYDEATASRARLFNALVRQVASSEPKVVSVVDLNHLLAPSGVYTASVDGIDVRSSDGIHISLDGGELLQREILPQIAQLGLKDETAVATATKAAHRNTAAGTRKHE
ncbi:MAG TPA: SGNH hydrolase domain-containing protein [Acidimicrobiales bacterium]